MKDRLRMFPPTGREWLFDRAGPWFVAGVLLLAAALKMPGVLSKNSAPSILATSGIVCLEVAIGLALVIGLRPPLLRFGAAILFAVFLCVSLAKALEGATTCGCLGSLRLSPWASAVLDVICMTLLGLWRPSPKGETGWLAVTAALGVPLLLGTVLVSASLLSSGQFPSLLVDRPMIDAGDVPHGARRKLAFVLRNPHAESVSVDKIESSCSCLVACDGRCRLDPGSEREFSLIVDPSTEPEFSGLVEAEVIGRTNEGKAVFSVHVRIRIIPTVAKATVETRETGFAFFFERRVDHVQDCCIKGVALCSNLRSWRYARDAHCDRADCQGDVSG